MLKHIKYNIVMLFYNKKKIQKIQTFAYYII